MGVDSWRILCLCERPDDILMWSHYGGSHGGICLEFHVFEGTYFSCAEPVDYPAEYPKLKITMETTEIVKGMILTKAAHWIYEQEWRIVDVVNHADLYHYHQNCLSGVVLGCQIAPKHEDLIREWLSKRRSPVTLYRAVKSKDKFALEIQEVEKMLPPVV